MERRDPGSARKIALMCVHMHANIKTIMCKSISVSVSVSVSLSPLKRRAGVFVFILNIKEKYLITSYLPYKKDIILELW